MFNWSFNAFDKCVKLCVAVKSFWKLCLEEKFIWNIGTAKSSEAHWHCLVSFMRRIRVRIPPTPLVVIIELSKKKTIETFFMFNLPIFQIVYCCAILSFSMWFCWDLVLALSVQHFKRYSPYFPLYSKHIDHAFLVFIYLSKSWKIGKSAVVFDGLFYILSAENTELLLVECFGFVFNNLSPQKRINEWGYGLSSYIQHYSSII